MFIALATEAVLLVLRVPLSSDLNNDGIVTKEEEAQAEEEAQTGDEAQVEDEVQMQELQESSEMIDGENEGN